MNKTEKQPETPQILEHSVISWFSVKYLPENRERVFFATTNGDVFKAIYMDKLINQYGDFDKVFISENGGYYQISMDIVKCWCRMPVLTCL